MREFTWERRKGVTAKLEAFHTHRPSESVNRTKKNIKGGIKSLVFVI